MDALFRINNQTSLIEPICDFTYRWALESGMSKKKSQEFALVLDELISDVMQHALKHSLIDFEISFFHQISFLEIVINEFGEPFDLEKHRYNKNSALLEGNLEGAGLALVEYFADDFIFLNHGKLGKEFRIIKNLTHTHVRKMLQPIEKIESNDTFIFDPVNENDSEDIAKLIYRTYAYSYPKEDMYYPERIHGFINKGKKFGVITRTKSNFACGYFAIIKSNDTNLGEVGEAVVSPTYRGKGLMTIMMTMLINMAKERDLAGIFGEAVTTHKVSQKVNARFEFTSTALIYAMYPSVDQKGFKHKQKKVSVVFEFLPLKDRTNIELYLPVEYKKIIKQIFKLLEIKIKDQKVGKIPFNGKTQLKLEINYNYGFATLQVKNFGEDFQESLTKRLQVLKKKSIPLVYLDLPLNQAGTKLLIPSLKKLGFVFAGVMPIFHQETDYLRLQWSAEPYELEDLKLFSPMALALKKQLQKDIKWNTKSKTKS